MTDVPLFDSVSWSARRRQRRGVKRVPLGRGRSWRGERVGRVRMRRRRIVMMRVMKRAMVILTLVLPYISAASRRVLPPPPPSPPPPPPFAHPQSYLPFHRSSLRLSNFLTQTFSYTHCACSAEGDTLKHNNSSDILDYAP